MKVSTVEGGGEEASRGSPATKTWLQRLPQLPQLVPDVCTTLLITGCISLLLFVLLLKTLTRSGHSVLTRTLLGTPTSSLNETTSLTSTGCFEHPVWCFGIRLLQIILWASRNTDQGEWGGCCKKSVQLYSSQS